MRTIWYFAELTQASTLVVAVLTIVVAIVHVSTSLKTFCTEEGTGFENKTKVTTCLGPALRWNTDDFFADSNGDDGWRSLFTFEPNQFFDLWTPTLVGIVSVVLHHPDSHSMPIEQSWPRYSLWFLFVALFSNFGYAGNLGIVNGFFAVVISAMCLVVHFSGETRSPDDMDIVKEWERNMLASIRGRPEVLMSTGRLLVMVVPVLTLICGVVHLVRTFSHWCQVDVIQGSDMSCLGPWFVWGEVPDLFVSSNNARWRGTVGTAPSVFLRNFTPLIVAVSLLEGHREGSSFQVLLSSWFKLFLILLITGLFANFGYAGNFGVVCGFVAVVASLLCLVLHFSADPQLPTFLQVRFTVQSQTPGLSNDAKESSDETRFSKETNATDRPWLKEGSRSPSNTANNAHNGNERSPAGSDSHENTFHNYSKYKPESHPHLFPQFHGHKPKLPDDDNERIVVTSSIHEDEHQGPVLDRALSGSDTSSSEETTIARKLAKSKHHHRHHNRDRNERSNSHKSHSKFSATDMDYV